MRVISQNMEMYDICKKILLDEEVESFEAVEESQEQIEEKYAISIGYKQAVESLEKAMKFFDPKSNLAKGIIAALGYSVTKDFKAISWNLETAMSIFEQEIAYPIEMLNKNKNESVEELEESWADIDVYFDSESTKRAWVRDLKNKFKLTAKLSRDSAIVSGNPKDLKKFLIHHYDNDEKEAKAIHPNIFEELEENVDEIASIVSTMKVGDNTNFGKVVEIGKDSITFKAKDLPKTKILFKQRKMGSKDYVLTKLTKI
jgi:hypothetical protein